MKKMSENKTDLHLVYYGDEFLRSISKDVTDFNDEIKVLAEKMLDSLSVFNGVGLAAVQVGYNYRMFVTDTRHEGERLVFINPVIIQTSADNVPYNEGCLSLPGVYKDVMRPSSVVITARDVNGNKFTLEAKGLLARVIQHEYDHLDGKVFIDHLSEPVKAKCERELTKNLKQKRMK